jgi:hypothetical protein
MIPRSDFMEIDFLVGKKGNSFFSKKKKNYKISRKKKPFCVFDFSHKLSQELMTTLSSLCVVSRMIKIDSTERSTITLIDTHAHRKYYSTRQKEVRKKMLQLKWSCGKRKGKERERQIRSLTIPSESYIDPVCI